MRNLIYLFVKFGGLIAFGVLEIFCMYLVVNYNKKQRSIFINSSNTISGMLYDRFDEAVKFWSLAEVADSLAEENARLRSQLRNAKFVETILQDSAYNEESRQRYTYIAAEIVNNSISKHSNNLTLNRGSQHGIQPRMGVFDDKGSGGDRAECERELCPRHVDPAQGKPYQCLPFVATIISGPVIWNGSNPQYVTLSDIPKHADLVKGDTVQTSGYSTIFPAGIMIGRIDTFWLEPGSNFYTVKVLLNNDLSKAKYVYVANDLMREGNKKNGGGNGIE